MPYFIFCKGNYEIVCVVFEIIFWVQGIKKLEINLIYKMKSKKIAQLKIEEMKTI